MRSVIRLLIVCFFGVTILHAAQYYVAPGATAGNGTITNPWPLQFALKNSSVVGSGDTLWLRGGTYFPPSHLSALSGTNAPVGGGFGWAVSISSATIRSYPNEWAKIDRPWRGTGSHLHFRDLEFYDSLKGFNPGNTGFAFPFPWLHFDGIANNKDEFVNCVIHDVNNAWAGSVVAKVRGCIIWHTGNNSYEHTAYSAFANQDTDEFSGNIVHWPSGAVIELGNPGLTISSNILVGTGETITVNGQPSILFCYSGQVIGNCDYGRRVPTYALNANGSGSENYIITNNIFSEYVPVRIGGPASVVFSGNTLYMNEPSAAYPSLKDGGLGTAPVVDSNHYYSANSVRFEGSGTNSWTFSQWQARGFDSNSTAANFTKPPDLVRVFPNADQPKRAHVAVYNWTTNDNVTVNLSNVLIAGDTYQLYSAQNYRAGPIRTGTYNGTNISVPMTNLTAAPFLYTSTNYDWGLVAPSPTSPEFAAFVVIGAATKTLPPPPNFHVSSPQ